MDREEDISYFTGTHEVHAFDDPDEIGHHKHMSNCKKNPGHKNFVPVKQLRVEHFAPGYHDNDVYDITKAIADLTVRIAVKWTSLERPQFLPGTKDPYPCYNTRGQNSLRTGTGWVCRVTRNTEEMDSYRTCPCPKCDHSDTPNKIWWTVCVMTATHVVFDESEARQSSCRLWFDDDKSSVVNIYGWKVGVSDNEDDKCELYCVTHDVDVGYKLKRMVWRFIGLSEKARDKYKSCRSEDKLTIIVSHPHGCFKQVSVGQYINQQVRLEHNQMRYTKYTYTNSTCPGSSGALVYRLGYPHLNSVAYSEGFNYSGIWGDIDF